MDGDDVVVRAGPASRDVEIGRFLEPARLLVQVSTKVQPPEVGRSQPRCISIAGVGGVEELVHVERLAEQSVGVGERLSV